MNFKLGLGFGVWILGLRHGFLCVRGLCFSGFGIPVLATVGSRLRVFRDSTLKPESPEKPNVAALIIRMGLRGPL